MKFGVREICDVVFKAKTTVVIGNQTFKPGQPVLYIDTAKTSTLEGGGEPVYATGGRGNTRLMSWEGERTVTFTVEDALISPIGLSILSGAGLFKGENATNNKVHVHKMSYAEVVVTEGTDDGKICTIDLSNALLTGNGVYEDIDKTAPIFISKVETDGSITGDILTGYGLNDKTLTKAYVKADVAKVEADKGRVFVDYYVLKAADKVSEIQIDAASFGSNFYVEASTLFRNKDGKDVPAELIFPSVKIQSNFTFNMSSTGDPSTFSFVMDAFPDYTIFNKKKKVLCAIQLLEDEVYDNTAAESVMSHGGGEIDEAKDDSTGSNGDDTYAPSTGTT